MSKTVGSIVLVLSVTLCCTGCASDAERGREKGKAEGVQDAAAKGTADGILDSEPRGMAAGQSRAKANAQAGFFWPVPYLPDLIVGGALGLGVFLAVQYFVLCKLGRLPERLTLLLVPGLEQNSEYCFRAGCKEIVQDARGRIVRLSLDAHLHSVAMANLRNLTEAVLEHALRFNDEMTTLSLQAFSEEVAKLIKSFSFFSKE